MNLVSTSKLEVFLYAAFDVLLDVAFNVVLYVAFDVAFDVLKRCLQRRK